MRNAKSEILLKIISIEEDNMDAGEDIIDVLYRIRDRSNSPMQRTLTRSRNVQQEDNVHGQPEVQRRRIQQQVSAPPPPRNYERDLYNLNRQSLAYRGKGRQSDSVFHRQNFNPSNQQSFYQHTRSRRYSGNNEDGTIANPRHQRSYRDNTNRPHKSEDNLDVDFEKRRSIRVDLVPRLDVEPKKHVSPKLIGLFLSDGGTIFVTIHMPASIPKGKNKSILYC